MNGQTPGTGDVRVSSDAASATPSRLPSRQARTVRPQEVAPAMCLRCRHADQVVSVPAVVREGRHVARVRGYLHGPPGYLVHVRVRGVQVSQLASMMAPPRVARSWISAAPLALVALFVLVIVEVNLERSSGSVASSWTSLVFLILAAVGVVRLRGRGGGGADVRRALWLWRRCWYCRRCGVVSHISPALSTVLPVEGLAISLVELAGRLDWRTKANSPVRRTDR